MIEGLCVFGDFSLLTHFSLFLYLIRFPVSSRFSLGRLYVLGIYLLGWPISVVSCNLFIPVISLKMSCLSCVILFIWALYFSTLDKSTLKQFIYHFKKPAVIFADLSISAFLNSISFICAVVIIISYFLKYLGLVYSSL